MTTDRQLDPSVLGHPPFGDVETGHDFDARRNCKRQMSRRGDHFIQHAVGFDPNPEFFFEWFEVDVAGVVLDRQQQHHVQQLANGCTIDELGNIAQVDRPVFGNSLCGFAKFLIRLKLADNLFDALDFGVKVLVDGPQNLLFAGDQQPNFVAQKSSQFVLHGEVLWIARSDGQDVITKLQWNNAIELGHCV